MQLRDQQRLTKIEEYCEDILSSMDRFGRSFSTFLEDGVY